ncbi:helix-turn-helix domain-containing protein [Limosilactobacillus vaginalis]|uniref:helix-turn-helix domain-containing protein n=1 Tax=Limosilactobacillus vaginalis TaxID=1633 RepID=UPI0022E8013F|nr:helix-turn-helix transcriptional regulator [Limosilactobacillus vaginalis]
MTAFDNIKRIAKKRGMSLQTVAEKAGLSRNLIYQYNGKTEPTLETIRKIADVLSVNVEDLVATSKSESNKKLADKVQGMSVDEALGTIMSFDGKPVTEHDKKVMKDLLVSYLKNKQ